MNPRAIVGIAISVVVFSAGLLAIAGGGIVFFLLVIVGGPVAFLVFLSAFASSTDAPPEPKLAEHSLQWRAAKAEEQKAKTLEDQLKRSLASLAFDLATAFNNSDHAAAVETWRSPPNAPFTPDDLIEVMRDAQTNGQRWNGRKVDAILQSQWGKFLRETYADSRDDFMLTLHDMSKRR